MNIKEKVDVALKIAGLACAVASTAMFGSMISKVADITKSVDHITATVERLVDIGPEGIADVGGGLRDAAENAGEGGANMIGKIRGALKDDH